MQPEKKKKEADGFGHEYSNVPPAYHFLCSVVTLGVGEARMRASKLVGGFCTVHIRPSLSM